MSRNPRDRDTETLTRSWLQAEARAKTAYTLGHPINDVEALRKETAVKKSAVLKHLRKVFSP